MIRQLKLTNRFTSDFCIVNFEATEDVKANGEMIKWQVENAAKNLGCEVTDLESKIVFI